MPVKREDGVKLRALAATWAVGLVTLFCVPRALAQVFSPFSEFQAMTLEELRTLQVKLTFVGEQRKPLLSTAFTSFSNTVDMTKFTPYRRPGIHYGNDDIGVRTFATSPEELEGLIDSLASLPAVTAGGVAQDVFLSFALFNAAGGDRAFESVLNPADSRALFAVLRQALQANEAGLQSLSAMGCHLGTLETQRPADVSSAVTVALSGLRQNRGSGFFVGRVTIKNRSAQALPAPISAVFDFEGSVRVANPYGTTCGTQPVGREFVNVPVPQGGLEPSGSAEVLVELDNLAREPIRATTRVLAGPGAR